MKFNEKDRTILKTWKLRAKQLANYRKNRELLERVVIRQNVPLAFKKGARESIEQMERGIENLTEEFKQET